MIDIRISPGSLDAVRGLVLGRTVPVGTAAVAFHTRARSKIIESAFAMRKLDEGKWEFVVTDAAGAVVSAGELPLCVRCHADAPADFLFVPGALATTVRSVGAGAPAAPDGGTSRE